MNIWPFIIAFLIISAAELGDKTQFLTFGLATKFSLWEVLSAVSFATSILMALAVIFGDAINFLIPAIYIQIFAGVLFIIFGLWTLLGKEEIENNKKTKDNKNPFWFIFIAFFMAELGDKTQITALALTAKYGSPLQIWLGATLGMIAVNLLAILAGKWLKNIISEKIIKWIGAIIFILFGIITLGGLFHV